MKTNYQQQIEAYLSGEMSTDQLNKFEAELESNPELNQELNFQSEIIQGIGEYRKTQLIARLDALKVPSVWWSFVQNSTALSYLSWAMITALIGTGIWFVIQDDSELIGPEVGSTVVDAPNQQLATWDIPELIKKESKIIEDGHSTVVGENQKRTIVREETRSFNPIVSVPLAGDIEADKNFVPMEVGEPSVVEGSNTSNKPISVEIVNSKNLKAKYRYYDGKLFLYGKFEQQPYEILEINSAQNKKIYLYHLASFYEILPSDKLVNLQIVTNAKLIQELIILRKTK